MTDIIPFPSKTVRDWAILERTMTEILTGAGADAAASSHIMRRMKEFFALLDRDFSASIHYELPSSTTVAQQEKLRAALEAMFASLATKWHDFTNEIMVDPIEIGNPILLCRPARIRPHRAASLVAPTTKQASQ